jgi:hypothetical protein
MTGERAERGPLTQPAFARVLGTPFRLRPPGAGELTLELVEVSPLTVRPGTESFAIVFRGPLDRPLAQGMYPMAHDQLGAFDLFIVPVGRGAGGVAYEAVFNRLVRT